MTFDELSADDRTALLALTDPEFRDYIGMNWRQSNGGGGRKSWAELSDDERHRWIESAVTHQLEHLQMSPEVRRQANEASLARTMEENADRYADLPDRAPQEGEDRHDD